MVLMRACRVRHGALVPAVDIAVSSSLPSQLLPKRRHTEVKYLTINDMEMLRCSAGSLSEVSVQLSSTDLQRL